MQASRLRKPLSTVERSINVDQLDLYRLLVFHTVVNEGTMAKASERLYITQPAISAHIKALEDGLGVALFNKVGRKSVVNGAGEVLYDKAQELLSVADDLRSTMEKLRGITTGRLVLGASVVWQYHLPRALERFKREYPHIEVTVQIANSDLIEKMVVDRSVDMGFIARTSSRADVVGQHVTGDELVIVCGKGHPFAFESLVEPAELNGEPLIIREAGSATRAATDALLNRLYISGDVSMELGSLEAVKQVAMSGHGLGFVSRASTTTEVRLGLLSIVSGAQLSEPMDLHIIYHKQKRLTLLQSAFLALISSRGVLPETKPRLIAFDAGSVESQRYLDVIRREPAVKVLN